MRYGCFLELDNNDTNSDTNDDSLLLIVPIPKSQV